MLTPLLSRAGVSAAISPISVAPLVYSFFMFIVQGSHNVGPLYSEQLVLRLKVENVIVLHYPDII